MLTQRNKYATSFCFKDTYILQVSSQRLRKLSATGPVPVRMHPSASAAANNLGATQRSV